MPFAEHPVQGQALHQAGRCLRLVGTKRQFDGFVDEAFLAQQPAGIQAQAIDLNCAEFTLQGVRDRRQQAVPLGVLVQWLEEGFALQQTAQDAPAVQLRPEPGTKVRRNPWQMGYAKQQAALLIGQARQHLAPQVVAHPRPPCPVIAAGNA
ncbi:hypothetical protein D9M70_571170 [compost metagenome]